MLTSIDVKFIFDSASSTASLRDKGLFSSANILQIADVVCRVVVLPFLLCFWPILRLFLTREMSELFRHFVPTTKTTQTSSPGLLGLTVQFFGNYAAKLMSFLTYRKFFQIWSIVAGYD